MDSGLSVYISVDMEGAAGIVAPSEVWEQGEDFALARELLVGEVNAAIQAAFDCGAARVVVNDAHMYMRNLSPLMLDNRAELIRGSQKLGFMMAGVEEAKGFQLALFIGYHSMAGTPNGVLCHTFSTQWANLWLNKQVVGEATYNAAYAGHFGCRLGLVSGDASLINELSRFLPWVEHVVVKQGIGNFAAKSVSPSTAREQICEGVKRTFEKYHNNELKVFTLNLPIDVQVDFYYPDRLERALYLPGVHRINVLSVGFKADDVIELNRYFRSLMILTS